MKIDATKHVLLQLYIDFNENVLKNNNNNSIQLTTRECSNYKWEFLFS